jgi:hypothetical protein
LRASGLSMAMSGSIASAGGGHPHTIPS